MKKQVLFFLFLSIVLTAAQDVCAQTPPVITYTIPKTFKTGTAISTLLPNVTGGAVYPGIYNRPAIFTTSDTPFSITIDGSNNVYTTDNTTGDVLKLDPSGNVISTVITGNSQASGIAIDKLGNVYVSQFTANSVLKYNSTGKLIATITNFNDPYGIAFDASNNAYVADYLSGNILKIAANDTVATTYLSGFTTPYGLVIDSNGNMYVGEQSVGDIIKINAGTTTKIVFASGFSGPRHLNNDNFGNIYVADYGNNAIKRVGPAGDITTLLNDGISSPRQAAFDSNGNLFFADYGTNTLKKSTAATYSISAPLPLGLSFDTSTGQISGTPATTLDPTNFIITASNTGGTSSTTITICIKAPTQALALPTANTLPASAITANSAIINGSANSNGDKTATVNFVYGLTPDLSGTVTTISPSGYTNVEAGTTVAFTASGLNPSSTYYYKVTATNTSGTTASSIASFTTLAPIKSSDATLSSLTLNQGALSPAFLPNINLYADSVNSLVTGIQLAALTNNGNATITLNGTAITSGTTSAPINLYTGNNSIVVVVTAQDGITSNTYTLNIYRSKTAQTINFPALITKTYGDADFSPGASATGSSSVIYTNDNPTVASIVNGKIHIIGPGTANITASQPGDASYATAGAITQTLTINKAPLIITANNASIAYGQPIPALSFTYSGFVNGDDPGKLATPVLISTIATATSAAGAYPVTVSGAVSSNYSFIYKPGILTIGQNNSSITFAAIPAKTYGDADFTLTSTSTSGLPVTFTSSDNTVAVINGSTLHIIGAGTVTITASQAGNTNYLPASSVVQQFTINKAPLTITANSSNIAYGQVLPAFTATYNGFVTGDDASKLITPVVISTTATAGSAAGSYPVTISGAASNNYSFIYRPGTLTIGQNNSSITFAAIPAKSYGDTDFLLNATSTSGLPVSYTSSDNNIAVVNGNTVHIVGAGTVTITASQSGNANYAPAANIMQTLIVNKATLNVSANDISITYGQAIPALTYSYSGFVNGDDPGKLAAAIIVNTTATINSPVGAYPISLSGAASNNYSFVYKPGVLTIARSNSSLIFNAIPTKTYGDGDFALISTSTSNLPITYTSSNNSIATVNGSMLHIVGAGSVTITASQAGNANYIATGSVAQILTINKALLTITANNISIAYGQAIPALTANYSGFVNSDNVTKLTIAAAGNSIAAIGSAAGIYPITFSGAASNNYSFSYQSGTLTIGQNSSNITFAAIPAKTYGDTDFLLNATSTSGLPVSYISSDNNITVINGNTVHIVGAGTVTITASQSGNANYAVAANVTQTLTINKAPLVITANNASIAYGQPIPALSFTYSGFVNGDDPGKLATPVLISTIATATSAAGAYPVTVSGAVSSNYSFIYKPGILTIGQNNSSITFAAIPAKTYGDADFTLTSTSTSGLPVTFTSSDNTVAVINGSTLHIIGAGTVTITASQAGNTNYLPASSVVQQFTINKAPLTITANSSNIAYGQVLPAFTATYNGFVTGDDASKLITPVVISTTATAGSAAGSYPVTISGAASNNYSFSYQSGTLTIGQNNSSITFAAIPAKSYGDTDFLLNATSTSGLPVSYTSSDNNIAVVNGNTVHIVGAGTVTITASQSGNANYAPAANITQTLSINKAIINIIANAQNKTYGDADQPLTYKITSGNLFNGDKFSGTLTRDAGEQVGTYTIKQGSLTINSNYTLNYVADKLTINKAPLTISANNSTINYGQPLPAFTVTYNGFVNGDNPGKLAAPVITSTTATATSSAGTYPIIISGATSNNYSLIYQPGTLTINQNNSNITFAAIPAKTYGDADFALISTSTSGLPVIFNSSDNTVAVVTGNNVHIINAGTAIITASQPGNSNYTTASSVAQQLTINKAILAITANSSSIAYGQAIPALTATYSGFVNGDNTAKLTANATGNTTAAVGSAAGIYPITFSGAASNNYLINYQPGTLTIGQNNSNITFAAIPAKTYGDADFDLASSVNSGLPVTYTSSNNNIAVINGNTVHILSVGTVVITASQAGNGNYTAATSVTQTLVINKAVVNVVANAQSKTYGDADQPLTYKVISGVLFNGDAFSGSLTRDAGEQVGVYSIKQGSLTLSNNYIINFVADKLTINKATLIITANNVSIAYGQVLPSFTITYSGFVNGDNPGKLTAPVVISTAATSNSSVGAYPIVGSGAASNNYSFTYQPGILVIGQNNSSIVFAPIPIKTYGDADVTLTSTSTSGLPVIYTSNDNSVATISGNTLHIVGAGTVIITASQPGNTNYTTAGSVAQILTVNKAPLTIAANNSNIVFGQAIPALTATYSGFVNSDNAAKLANQVIISTTAAISSAAGSYPISVMGAASSNYSIIYQPGTLTIGQNNSSITFAAIAAKTYGDADFDLTSTNTSGLPVSYTSSNSNVAVVSGNNVHIISAGTVTITASQSGNTNYTAATSVTQTLTINKANVVVTANMQSKTYGDADPLLTYKITNGALFNGDTFSGTLTRDAGEQAGTYSIKQGSVILSNNYSLTYIADKLTINKASLIIIANNSSIPYGQVLPVFTVTYSGFVNGDDPGKLTSKVVTSTVANTNSPAGAYPILVGGASSNNYLFTFQPGILNIGQNNSTISFATIASKTYGDADFTLNATSTSGLPVTYTSSDNAVATVNGNTLHIIGAGTVTITASQPGNANYNAAGSVSQTFIVNKALLNITANSISITYGQAIPALTISYSGFVNGDNSGGLTAPAVISTTALATSPVGPYPVTVSGAVSSNYNFVYHPGTITIGQNNSNITFAALATKTYGDADFTLNATSTSGLPITYISSDNAVATVNGNTLHIIGAGTVNLIASQPGNANYNAAGSVAQTLVVNKTPLIITANNINIAYGNTIPTLTVTYSGFVNNDDAGKLKTPVVINTSAIINSPAGVYPITLGGANSNNYTVVYHPGIVTIGQNNSNITFAALATKTYGDADFTFNATSTSGLPVTYTSSDNAVATVNGNTLHIIGAGTVTITASQPGNANYNAAGSVAQTFIVNKALLNITANNISITYGQAIPALTISYSGFVNGDNSGGLTAPAVISTTALATSPVGPYPVTVSGAVSSNYNFVYHPGTITIGQNNSNITFAALVTKTYGDADFTLNATSTSGLPITYTSSDNAVATVNGNTLHIIGAGTVTITASQPGNANYTAIGSVAQALTVNKAQLTITADNISIGYGDAIPKLTYTFSGFVNADNMAKLSTPVAISTTATANSAVGSYLISVSGASISNYTIAYQSGTLTIGQNSSTLTFADIPAKTYGDLDFALVGTSSVSAPIVYTSSDNTIATVTGSKVHIVGAGTITITASQPGNTAVSLTKTLTVNKALLTVKAKDINIIYGDNIPRLSISYTGFVNGDDSTKLTTLPGLSVPAVGGSAIGTYVISVKGAASNNYNFSYQPGTLVIGQNNSVNTLAQTDDGITVHPAVSPNGDGINDFLMIEGIEKYSSNKIAIVNRSGALVSQIVGYDNSSKVFDGHSNITGVLLQPGTYYYKIEYVVDKGIKSKTGFFILKY